MFLVDATSYSCVMVFRECGTRILTRDRRGGWLLAAEHEATAHPGHDDAAHRVKQATRRARRDDRE